MAFKPTRDNVMVKFVRKSETTEGGLYLPEGSEGEEDMKDAIVQDVGPDCKVIKKGFSVIFGKYSAVKMNEGGEEIVFVKDKLFL